MLVHEMNNFIVIGGHVIHSYGRLVHDHNVITRGDQLLPPGNGTAPTGNREYGDLQKRDLVYLN